MDIHCEVFESADLKFPVCGRSKHIRIHTRVRNAVTLVWGSLRLAPKITVGVDIHCEIFESADLKFPVCGRSKHSRIHTHVRNAVMLVWGSLRLAPKITVTF